MLPLNIEVALLWLLSCAKSPVAVVENSSLAGLRPMHSVHPVNNATYVDPIPFHCDLVHAFS